MELYIDATCLTNRKSGIGKYTESIIYHLSKLPEIKLYLCSNRTISYDPPKRDNVIFILESNGLFKRMPASIWVRYRLPMILRKENVTAIWGPAFTLPKMSGTRVLRILTIHDFIVELGYDHISFLKQIRHRLFLKRSVSESNLIITNSVGTAEKLHLLYDKKADFIINPPVPCNYYDLNDKDHEAVLGKYNLEEGYILVVGATTPRKNLSLMIDSYINARSLGAISAGTKLVICGVPTQVIAPIIRRTAYSNDILTIDYIGEADMPYIYQGAQCLLYMSSYEGYGMPLAECLAVGTTVVTSDTSETREASHGRGHYCRLTVDDIVKALTGVFSSDSTMKGEGIRSDNLALNDFAAYLICDHATN